MASNNAAVSRWYKNHPEYNREKSKRFMQTHVGTRVDGKLVFLDAPDKRPKPDHCELCGRRTAYLGYHHWDDSNPSKGLWLGYCCHQFAEMVDKGMVRLYFRLKLAEEERFKKLYDWEIEKVFAL